MLELEVFDGRRQVVLKFEHSLRSISKWEAKYKVCFLSKQRTAEEMVDYFRCMLLNKKESPEMIYRLSPEQLEELTDYINTPQTASTVPKEKSSGPKETISSELVYYWMTEMKIDWEAQDWHFSRLMMLIQIINYKRQPPKKQRISEFRDRWQAANEARRKQTGSTG